MIAEDKVSANTAVPNGATLIAVHPISRAAARHLEISKVAQSEVLADSQAIFDRWCTRRRETAAALATLGQDALQAKSPQDFLKVWVQWSKGAVNRLLDDARDNVAAQAAVARNVTGGSTAMALSWVSKPQEAETANSPAVHCAKGDLKPAKDARH